MKSKKLLWVIIILGILVIAGSGGYLLLNRPKKAETSLQTALATRRDIGSAVQATGTIKAVVGAEVTEMIRVHVLQDTIPRPTNSDKPGR